MNCFVTWDLERNKEVSSYVLSPEHQDFKVCRGMNSTFDYLIYDNKIIDLEYGFKMHQFEGKLSGK